MTRRDSREINDGGHVECAECGATFPTMRRADRHIDNEHDGAGTIRFHDKEPT